MLQRIYTVFASILLEKERNEISVADLCEAAGIEHSTFYANYGDISGLANIYVTLIKEQIAAQPYKGGKCKLAGFC